MDQRTIITHPARGEFSAASASNWTIDMIGPEGAIGTLKAAMLHIDAVPNADMRFRIGDTGDGDKHLDWTVTVAEMTAAGADGMITIFAGASLQGPFRNRILERDSTIQVRNSQTGASQGVLTFQFVVEWDLANPRMRPQ